MSGYDWVRPWFFRLPPERAHALTLGLVRLAGGLPLVPGLLDRCCSGPNRPVQVFGLTFRNPVGLAAGYDKDARGWRGLAHLGFGHIEIGTVTPRPQPGNPPPRLFRLVEDQALINRMGFPGRGGRFVARQLSHARPAGLVLGVNIGKNKDTALDDAAQDYILLLRQFAHLADYLAINVSSPNTVGLRHLQGRQALEALLGALAQERRDLLAQHPSLHLPLLVKLAPDLDEGELEDALEVILAAGMDGVIATNTTLTRDGLRSPLINETGGLSGAPLFMKSLRLVHQIWQLTGGSLPVIGVGGIHNADTAQAMLDAGASLVQVYTGLVYRGPGLVRDILGHLPPVSQYHKYE